MKFILAFIVGMMIGQVIISSFGVFPSAPKGERGSATNPIVI